MLTAQSPEVADFVAAYQENRNLAAHNWRYVIVVSERRKYLAVDEADANENGSASDMHRSGRFMVDRETSVVYTIRGYGQRGDRIGTLATLTAKFREGSASFQPEAGCHVETGRSRVASWGKTPERLMLRVVQ